MVLSSTGWRERGGGCVESTEALAAGVAARTWFGLEISDKWEQKVVDSRWGVYNSRKVVGEPASWPGLGFETLEWCLSGRLHLALRRDVVGAPATMMRTSSWQWGRALVSLSNFRYHHNVSHGPFLSATNSKDRIHAHNHLIITSHYCPKIPTTRFVLKPIRTLTRCNRLAFDAWQCCVRLVYSRVAS